MKAFNSGASSLALFLTSTGGMSATFCGYNRWRHLNFQRRTNEQAVIDVSNATLNRTLFIRGCISRCRHRLQPPCTHFCHFIRSLTHTHAPNRYITFQHIVTAHKLHECTSHEHKDYVDLNWITNLCAVHERTSEVSMLFTIKTGLCCVIYSFHVLNIHSLVSIRISSYLTSIIALDIFSSFRF